MNTERFLEISYCKGQLRLDSFCDFADKEAVRLELHFPSGCIYGVLDVATCNPGIQYVLVAPPMIQLFPDNDIWKAVESLSAQGPATQVGKPEEPWIVAASLLSPGHCDHLRSEGMGGKSFFFSSHFLPVTPAFK